MTDRDEWPALPFPAWRDTCETLHLYAQIVGKIRLGLAPLEPGWTNVPFYLAARGLTTSAIPFGERILQIDFDFVEHSIELATSDGRTRSIPLLPPRCVADIYADVMNALSALDVEVKIWPMAVEVAHPVRCSEDRVHASYDPEYVRRFWQVLVRLGAAFLEHRAPFRGRHTQVQFYWGTFDVAYVRFSGRPAEPPPNSNIIERIGIDGEEIAAGFWPGNDRFPEPAFYCYAYPKPAGVEAARILPAAAHWDDAMGEFLLRYDDVRCAPSPRAALLEFLSSTYEACAVLARWDRSALDGTPPARRG